jgi:hypothetical protein
MLAGLTEVSRSLTAATTCLTTSGQTTTCSVHFSGADLGIVIAVALFYLAFLVFFVICYAKIIRKAGYSAWWLLILLVPIANLVMVAVFAFAEWPVIKEVNRLRAIGGLGGPGQPWGRRSGANAGNPGGFGSISGPGGAPAGWYPSGNEWGEERYYDGNNWTDHFRPRQQ